MVSRIYTAECQYRIFAELGKLRKCPEQKIPKGGGQLANIGKDVSIFVVLMLKSRCASLVNFYQ